MKRFIILLAALIGAISCTSSPTGISRMPAPIEPALIEYQMGVGDRIAVQVWKAPELSVTVPVRPDGKISVPLVGDVKAAGVSASTLAKGLTNDFAGYVRNPQVTVVVLDPVSAEFLRRVRVTGAVKQPLSINYRQGMTVLDLVLQAGGVTEFARSNKAKLYRKYGDKVDVFPIHLDDILNKGLVDTNYILAPSDIITVPERLL